MDWLATIVARVFEGYAGCGLVFALGFLPRGIVRVDPHLAGSPVGVRLLILPGVAAFWPLFAWRWWHGIQAPEERNPHRIAARRGNPGSASRRRATPGGVS
jgi:hypothetical protein